MPQTKAVVPVPLAPPLRAFHVDDAATVARLNDMASGGILLSVWNRKVGPGGDPWEEGRLQQVEQMNSGWVMAVLDRGAGVEAVLMGQPHPVEPVPVESVDPEWAPLVELENMVPGAWCLNVIATLPERRGQGHAARLMALAEDIARAGGHGQLALVVAEANAGAIRLYQRCGFAEKARRAMVKGDWDGPGHHWVLMVKPLQAVPD
ncbi:GNAT family N-acetyltransferase [Mameliella sediminis]|uniref:GNAT family N-acetyltransferase n=1 Tax=Mameliella sediminis TaxID=2836866 RepID=UPI001C454317|nr:GNAT family N-acetyltransferase [Mameliella sediminis]MBV7394482.1 GNAT family N-acetyltransferase [Mameliella sediminis]